MAGLYIHIPFCRNKCDYCDFFSMPLTAAARQGGNTVYQRYVDALLVELKLRRNEISEPIRTIYIGGGTPSALPRNLLPELVKALLAEVDEHSLVKEVTIEANPEDVTSESLKRWQDAGVNRISIGVQSFDSGELHDAGRRHPVEAGVRALELLHAERINFNADLMYGLPGQSLVSWSSQLRRLLSYSPNHVSAYLLSYEPGTKLFVRRAKGAVKEADEQLAVEMYTLLCEEMSRNGYRHYEISNFALPGYSSAHNSSYWNLTPYLGLGCSAHSFDGINRRFNPSNLIQYLHNIERGAVAAELDEETVTDRVNDYIITSLRTDRGLSVELVMQKWGGEVARNIIQNCAPFIEAGQLKFCQLASEANEEESAENLCKHPSSGRIVIPEKYWLTADNILRNILLE